MSHDLVNLYLQRDRLSASTLWRSIKADIVPSENGYIIFDDTVLDKHHARKIDSVRWQYSGNAHKVIRGIGMVNCVYVNPETEEFWPIDFRIFDPTKDGKSKLEHVKDMLNNLVYHKRLPCRTVLMDSWYASHQLMLFIHDLDKYFYCPLKKNRQVNPIDSEQKYGAVRDLSWDDEQYATGQLIQLKGMPKHIPLKVFSVSVSTHRTDFVVTNDVSQACADDTKSICAIRWYVEQFHRELKQLTGVEACQCRKQRIQRNHIACAVLVWAFLKRKAQQSGKTVYQLKRGLMKNYLINELKEPAMKFSFS